jgi:hypothetical protein
MEPAAGHRGHSEAGCWQGGDGGGHGVSGKSRRAGRRKSTCVLCQMDDGPRSARLPVGRYKPWALDVWEARLRPLSCHGLCTEGASRKALLPCVLDMSMHGQAVDRWDSSLWTIEQQWVGSCLH